jgi:hypothetical protein
MPATTNTHRARRTAVLAIGVAVALALLLLATSSRGHGSPTYPFTPRSVPHPVSSSVPPRYCHWRPYGWFCSSSPKGPQYPLAEESR